MHAPHRRQSRDGFTIVELLIVVVVIAILAVITIVAYNGITKRAVDSSMRADLRKTATALELDKTSLGSYPQNSTDINGGKGLSSSGSNQLTYEQKSYGYCISVSHPSANSRLRIRSTTGEIEVGACGMIWTVATATPSNSGTWKDIAFGNGRFVAMSSASGGVRALTSTDGVSWTRAAYLPGSGNWTSITYGNGRFVVVGTGLNSNMRMLTSTDGVSWTAMTGPAETEWVSVTYGNGRFVALGRGEATSIGVSTDGVTWSAYTVPSSIYWQSITYGNGRFVAASNDPQEYGDNLMSSTDGASWTMHTSPGASYYGFSSISYGGGQFLALQGPPSLSTDGINWTAIDNSSVGYIATYGNGRFLTLGSSTYASSADGVSWETGPTPSGSWSAVAYGSGCFAAVADYGTNRIMYSCE